MALAAALACSLPAAAHADDPRIISCTGTQQRGAAQLNVQVKIMRPEARTRMLALVDRNTSMAQQLIARDVGEGVVEIVEGAGGVTGTPRRYPFVEVREPDTRSGASLVGFFFAGELNPSVLRADLWDSPKRFVLSYSRDAEPVRGACE